ncbi:hypothetical protein [Cryptosporangium sp. NPDC048952]|uniref:aggregation-promoting factor C-terminal-like domain-containing protein n=1 Tax=Cryptosporangium sp. NPDC048952 TaxID=3363961 RepID=UPI0037219AFD
MTYVDDRESPELPRRRRHSSDTADVEQYVYERPADWQPRRRRAESFEDLGSYEAPTDATPVDWWGQTRGEGSAWDADALRAAAGVPIDNAYSNVTAPVPPAYGHSEPRIPEQRRPAEENPDFAIEAPATHKRSLPRKHLVLRVAAVLVLVFSAAIGVAVTVLHDTDPDTVQVKEDLQADAPVADAPVDASADAAAAQAAQDQAQQKQDDAVSAAKSRAADKATAAQKTAAKQAEHAEDQRSSRSEARKAAAPAADTSSSSSSSSSTKSGGNSGDPVPEGPADCGSYSGNKKTGCSLLSEFGFATSQMSCLEKLWDKESTWRETAKNPSSGAYGIPQALPASKMASVASDYLTNPATQIRWGLGYIKGRYSTPCGAWSHSQANGWY